LQISIYGSCSKYLTFQEVYLIKFYYSPPPRTIVSNYEVLFSDLQTYQTGYPYPGSKYEVVIGPSSTILFQSTDCSTQQYYTVYAVVEYTNQVYYFTFYCYPPYSEILNIDPELVTNVTLYLSFYCYYPPYCTESSYNLTITYDEITSTQLDVSPTSTFYDSVNCGYVASYASLAPNLETMNQGYSMSVSCNLESTYNCDSYPFYIQYDTQTIFAEYATALQPTQYGPYQYYLTSFTNYPYQLQTAFENIALLQNNVSISLDYLFVDIDNKADNYFQEVFNVSSSLSYGSDKYRFSVSDVPSKFLANASGTYGGDYSNWHFSISESNLIYQGDLTNQLYYIINFMCAQNGSIGQIISSYDYLYDLQQRNKSYLGGSLLNWNVSNVDGNVDVLSTTAQNIPANDNILLTFYGDFSGINWLPDTISSFVQSVESTLSFYVGSTEGLRVNVIDYGDNFINFNVVCIFGDLVDCDSIPNAIYAGNTGFGLNYYYKSPNFYKSNISFNAISYYPIITDNANPLTVTICDNASGNIVDPSTFVIVFYESTVLVMNASMTSSSFFNRTLNQNGTNLIEYCWNAYYADICQEESTIYNVVVSCRNVACA